MIQMIHISYHPRPNSNHNTLDNIIVANTKKHTEVILSFLSPQNPENQTLRSDRDNSDDPNSLGMGASRTQKRDIIHLT